MFVEALDLDDALLDFVLSEEEDEGNATCEGRLHLPLRLRVVRVRRLRLHAHAPQLTAQLKALAYQALPNLSDVNLRFSGPYGVVLLEFLLKDREHALNANGDTHRGDLLAREHAHEAVVPAAACD